MKHTNYTGVFYVGLGDQFDDERRLVREAASEFRSEHPRNTNSQAELPDAA
jgi:asparagine synthetase B (glutamine-hydrolysing)